MNLIYEELIKQSKPIPEWTRTDQYQVGLTMNGTVEDPAFVRFVEKVSNETSVIFNTHDWMLLAAASRGEKLPKGSEARAAGLLDLGLIEKVKGRNYMLSRRYYEFVGEKAAYTRKKGLDRKQNLALLLKHIEENKAAGCKLEELCQVLSALPTSQVQSLMRTLQRRNEAHSVGKTNQAHWFPGPAPILPASSGKGGTE